jgi:hypothetical protein
MAKKATNISVPKTPVKAADAVVDSSVKATVSRNSPVPKAAPAKREISQEMIAKRAYEIFATGRGGSQDDNWHRAERELRSSL